MTVPDSEQMVPISEALRMVITGGDYRILEGRLSVQLDPGSTLHSAGEEGGENRGCVRELCMGGMNHD